MERGIGEGERFLSSYFARQVRIARAIFPLRLSSGMESGLFVEEGEPLRCSPPHPHRYRSRATFAVERSAFDSRLAFVRRTIITRIRDGARRNRTFNVCTSVYTLESICRFAVRPATSRSIRRLDHQLRSLRSTPTSLVGSFASRGRARSRRADHASLSIVQLCCSQIIGNKGN